MFAIGMLPSMPKLPFFALAIVLLIVWSTTREVERSAALAEEEDANKAAEPPEVSEEEQVAELLKVDRVCLEIGYRLIPLVEDGNGGGADPA